MWLFQYFEWTPLVGDLCEAGFTVRRMRAQVLVLFCWSLSGVCSNLSPSHVWERHFVKVQRYFSAAWSFFSESHVPLPQVLSRVRACSHVLLHVLSFELLGLCKRLACVKRRTTFLRDRNLLKLLCFLLLQGMVAVLSGKWRTAGVKFYFLLWLTHWIKMIGNDKFIHSNCIQMFFCYVCS